MQPKPAHDRGKEAGKTFDGNPFRHKELKRIAKLKNPQQTIEALSWSRANGS